MSLGSLYKIKKYYWFLYPTEESIKKHIRLNVLMSHSETESETIQWCRKLNISYVPDNSIFVLLERDREFSSLVKILTNDGNMGWLFINQNDFEELI